MITTKARPVSADRARKNERSAPNPPVEPPNPTTVKPDSLFEGSTGAIPRLIIKEQHILILDPRPLLQTLKMLNLTPRINLQQPLKHIQRFLFFVGLGDGNDFWLFGLLLSVVAIHKYMKFVLPPRYRT